MKNYRRCLSCRKLALKDSLLRIVRTYPEQKVQLNQGMGRSAYVCPNQECLTMAQKKNRLAKSLKTTVPPEIYADLGKILTESRSSP